MRVPSPSDPELSLGAQTPGVDSFERRRSAASVAAALFGAASEVDPTALGRYRIEDRLGHGAMGVVYRAYDPELARAVALKVIPAQGRAREELVAEARAAAAVAHPHVVKIHEAGVEGSRAYVAMELIEGGQTLADWIGAPRSWRALCMLFAQIARALAAVHERGLLHRDLKPANVLVQEVDGRAHAHVADFGLARPVLPADASDNKISGTLNYMAPEQLRGEPDDPAMDQFAFFVALHEALAGRSLPRQVWDGPERFLDARAAGLEQLGFGSCPRWLRRTIERGHAAEARARFSSMDEVVAALERTPVRRRRLGLGLGFALALIASAGGSARLAQPTGPRCEEVAASWTQFWSATRKAELAKGLAGALEPRTPSLARDTPPRVEAQLDRWTRAFIGAREHACARGLAAQERAHDPVDACLDELELQARELVSLLSSAEPSMALHAIGAVTALPPPAGCLQREGARAIVSTSASPDELARLRRVLASAEALAVTFEFPTVLELLDAHAAAFEAAGATELLARYLVLRGTALEQAGAIDEAAATFERGVFLAVGIGAEPVAAHGSRQLLWLEGKRRRDLVSAERWNGLSAAWERAAALGPGAKAGRLDKLGVSLELAGQAQRANEVHIEAVELAAEAWGEDSPQMLPILTNATISAWAAGERELARQLNRDTERLAIEVLGAEHPAVSYAIVNRPYELDAEICRTQLPDLQRALGIRERAYGAQGIQLAPAISLLAACRATLEQWEPALALHRRSIEIRTRYYGSDTPHLANSFWNSAECEMELGRPEAALASFERAKAVVEPKGGEFEVDIDAQIAKLRAELGVP